MIQFVENDSEKIINNLVAQFEAALGEKLQPSDERTLFLYQFAQVLVQLNSTINDTGNQVLLRYARGTGLDAIGELLGVKRSPATYASCIMKFTLAAIQTNSVVIPKGTRATPDGYTYFATEKDLIIPAGSLTGEVEAIATQEGSSCNGYAEKTIKYIVDNVQFLKEVENTTETTGGTDQESDDSLRERIRLAPESYSTAGTSESYIYWAKTASTDVGDVVVYSPVNDTSLSTEEREAGAGRVYIYITKKDGTIPDVENNENDRALLDKVAEVVSAKDKRPLTDFVTVLAPTVVEYSVNLGYYIAEEDEMNAATIDKKVKDAVSEYIAWQGAKIGRDINPDKLRYLVLNAGASRVDIQSPTFQTLSKMENAKLVNQSITALGISE